MTNVTEGLRVKTVWGNTGTVIDIDMHYDGFTDVLVELDNGNLVWFSHRDLKPKDEEAEAGDTDPDFAVGSTARKLAALEAEVVQLRELINKFADDIDVFSTKLMAVELRNRLAELDAKLDKGGAQ